MVFTSKIKEDALVACGRHCCICHKFCGTKIEVHHVETKGDGGGDTFANAIPLCFDCHADMSSYDHNHPKGTKYTNLELIRHRDNWYEKVKNNIGLANKDEIVETDKNIYKVLVKILPWDGSIKFLRTNDFAGIFERKELDDIQNFAYQCKNPAFEFIDPDLEGLQLQLLGNVSKFMQCFARQTFHTHNAGYSEVPPEWRIGQPERFNNVVESLNDSAELICEDYDNLVRTATRKLGVLPDSMG